MKITPEIKQQLIAYRERGYSVPELSVMFRLSKSTVFRSVGKIHALPEYQNRWLQRKNASKIISEKQWQQANEKAKNLIGDLDESNLALVISCLYWAEGTKKDFCFTNTDPEMIRIFIIGLRNIFNVKDEDLKVSIRIYEDLNISKCLEFWSEKCGFDLRNKASVNLVKGSKRGKLEYGMCRVRVKKAGLILKTISAINKRVSSLIYSGYLAYPAAHVGFRSSMDRAAAS